MHTCTDKMVLTTFVVGSLLLNVQALAQEPVVAKRLAPEKEAAQPDDNAAQQALERELAKQLQSATATANLQPAAGSTVITAPAGYKPRLDIHLGQTAQEAVQMSEKWTAEHNQPTVGQAGRVLYTFGAGLPTMVCAPLRVCIIELQPGEKLVGEPHIGDSVRWNISPAAFGSADSSTAVIVLKPQSSGLDTNLLVTTDRRAYYLRLLSKPEDYVSRVAFAYPDDENKAAKWHVELANQKAEERKASITDLAGTSVDSLNFEYRIKSKDEKAKPVRVFDDGQKTYLQISRETQRREAPVLVVIGRDGKQEMVNYRVKGDMYIVDRLFDRAQLVLGTGKKAEKVEISREKRS